MLERVEAFIHAELESRNIPGAAVAIVRPGEPTWSRGFGTANVETGEPFTPTTPFSIQSITKTFVGTAIMQLQERAVLSVDDPVAKHLPGVVQNEWEAENPVLVRHLLTHTSGLPVDTAGGLPGGLRLLEEFVRLVAKTVRPPGAEIVYANWGYATAGLLIEKLSRETWYGYIKKHICEPLGMRVIDAYPAPDDAAYGHYLSGVDGELHRLGRAQWPVDPSDPAGGLVSTVEDLAIFATAHLNGGGEIMRSDTASAMHAVSALEPGGGGMALGFRSTRSNGRRLLCHGGDGAGFTNFLGLYPDDDVAVVITLNRGGMQAARAVIGNGVLALLTGEAPGAQGSSSPTAVRGLYTSNFWDIELAVEPGEWGVAVTPLSGVVLADGPEPSDLNPVGDASFVGRGGMFDGFEVSLGPDGALYGGLYPYRFSRVGDIPVFAEEPLDEEADLIGAWRGTVTTPMGALAVTIDVTSPVAATVSTPFAQGVPLADFEANSGHISGRFGLTVPGVGENTMFPRLEVRGGKLKGPIYAQGWFGEISMPAELEKA